MSFFLGENFNVNLNYTNVNLFTLTLFSTHCFHVPPLQDKKRMVESENHCGSSHTSGHTRISLSDITNG